MEREKLTIKEIAKLAGLSVSTVSRAINNHYDIKPETKRRVEEIIERYGYVPNNSARNLKISDSRNIAVLVKGITNPFFTGMIRVLEEECSKKEYSLVLQHVEEKRDEIEVAALLEREKRLNGLLFLGGSPLRSAERLRRIQVPFVFCSVAMDPGQDLADYDYVTIDDRRESRKITDYLLESGRKRIAILSASEEDESIGALRLRGYLESLIAHGISADPALIVRPACAELTYTHENGYLAVRHLLEQGVDFDAVYAISDQMAIGAMRALQDSGIRIPEQVAVAGFDGLDTGRFLIPSLTTLAQPVERMAMESITLLFAKLSGEAEVQERCHQIFAGELKKRESA